MTTPSLAISKLKSSEFPETNIPCAHNHKSSSDHISRTQLVEQDEGTIDSNGLTMTEGGDTQKPQPSNLTQNRNGPARKPEEAKVAETRLASVPATANDIREDQSIDFIKTKLTARLGKTSPEPRKSLPY
jgi:hypothetical protein